MNIERIKDLIAQDHTKIALEELNSNRSLFDG